MILEAIDSVQRQPHFPSQIIVIDDASTDHTPAVLAALVPNITVLTGEGKGPAMARNVGLRHATGDLIGFLDSDDLWTETALELQVAALERAIEAGIAWGMAQWRFLPGATSLGGETDGAVGRIVGVNSLLFRRPVLEQLGGFDPQLRFGEDHDIIRRARAAGIGIVEHSGLVAIHRRHAGNMTVDRSAARAGQMQAARAALLARRKASLR
jgi:glycosyltransferase involved in cell wall biosynthesis